MAGVWAAMKLMPTPCPICAGEVWAIRRTKKYCSERCRGVANARRGDKAAMKRRVQRYVQTEKGRENRRKLARQAYYADPLKFQAHGRVRRALRRGDLAKPDACEKCAAAVFLEAHHHRGYEPAVQLDVQWLCRTCHRRIHRPAHWPALEDVAA